MIKKQKNGLTGDSMAEFMKSDAAYSRQ